MISRTHKIQTGVSLAILGLFSILLWERYQIHTLKDQLFAMQQFTDELQAKLKTQSADADRLLQNVAHNAVPVDAEIVDRNVPRKTKSSSSSHPPEYRIDRSPQTLRRDVQRIYGEILGALNLSPDKLSELKKLLIERREAVYDVREVTREMEGAGSGFLQSAIKNVEAQIDTKIQILIGEPAYAEIRNVLEGARYLTELQSGYALDVAYEGSPLTSTQLIQLTGAMFDASKGPMTREYREIPDPTTGLTGMDTEVLRKAAAMLTREQYRMLSSHLIDQHIPRSSTRSVSSGGL